MLQRIAIHPRFNVVTKIPKEENVNITQDLALYNSKTNKWNVFSFVSYLNEKK